MKENYGILRKNGFGMLSKMRVGVHRGWILLQVDFVPHDDNRLLRATNVDHEGNPLRGDTF